MQARVYRTPILDAADLKRRLTAAWSGLQQHVIVACFYKVQYEHIRRSVVSCACVICFKFPGICMKIG